MKFTAGESALGTFDGMRPKRKRKALEAQRRSPFSVSRQGTYERKVKSVEPEPEVAFESAIDSATERALRLRTEEAFDAVFDALRTTPLRRDWDDPSAPVWILKPNTPAATVAMAKLKGA